MVRPRISRNELLWMAMTMPLRNLISLRVAAFSSWRSTGLAVMKPRHMEHDLGLRLAGGEHQHHSGFARS